MKLIWANIWCGCFFGRKPSSAFLESMMTIKDHWWPDSSHLTHWGWEKFYRKTQDDDFISISSMKCVNLVNISPKIVPWRFLSEKSALVQEMDWCRLGAKPFLGPMMSKTLTQICDIIEIIKIFINNRINKMHINDTASIAILVILAIK